MGSPKIIDAHRITQEPIEKLQFLEDPGSRLNNQHFSKKLENRPEISKI